MDYVTGAILGLLCFLSFLLGIFVGEIKSRQRKRTRAVKIQFAVSAKGLKMQMLDTQKLVVTVQPEDAAGFAASLDPAAIPAWSVDNAALASIAPNADGLSAVVTPLAPGAFNVQFSVPAVNDEPAIAGSLAVTIVAGVATQVVLSGVAQ